MNSQEPGQINIQQELETLVSAVDFAAKARLGTFSQRNPMLGKMARCPHCKTRRRQNAELPCCTAILSTKYLSKVLSDGTREERERPEITADIPRSDFAKKRKNPRLTRHRPPLFQMRQTLLDLEAEPLLIGPLQDSVEGLEGFHTPQKEVQPQHLAAFVEKVILRKLRQVAKKKRSQQKLSRKINRG